MPEETAQTPPRTHTHNAEAKALHGSLTLPLRHVIQPQAQLHLDPTGKYHSVPAKNFRAEGVVSYTSAYSQVSGNRDPKHNGWTTLSSVVVEDLNILEVVTADRVVAQIIADHPAVGYVPEISFLGTRFDNLRIAGHPVDVALDLNLFGKPEKDIHYTKKDGPFLRGLREHYKHLWHGKELPADALKSKVSTMNADILEHESLTFSLVSQIDCHSEIRFPPLPGTCAGHTIHIPHFGTVTFANVTVHQEEFVDGVPHKTTVELTMVDANFGCVVGGDLTAAYAKTNGTSVP